METIRQETDIETLFSIFVLVYWLLIFNTEWLGKVLETRKMSEGKPNTFISYRIRAHSTHGSFTPKFNKQGEEEDKRG